MNSVNDALKKPQRGRDEEMRPHPYLPTDKRGNPASRTSFKVLKYGVGTLLLIAALGGAIGFMYVLVNKEESLPVVQDRHGEIEITFKPAKNVSNTPPASVITETKPLISEKKPNAQPASKLKKNETPDLGIAQWVKKLNFNSISETQMFIDGKMYQKGSIVNEFPVILWTDIDTQRGVITFEDETGVKYEKNY